MASQVHTHIKLNTELTNEVARQVIKVRSKRKILMSALKLKQGLRRKTKLFDQGISRA